MKYIWNKRDTHVEGVVQLKLVILDHVNMAWTIYTLTCEHCMICQFDDYLYLCTYIAQCINVSILRIFYLNDTHVEGVVQLKLVILDHVNMA